MSFYKFQFKIYNNDFLKILRKNKHDVTLSRKTGGLIGMDQLISELYCAKTIILLSQNYDLAFLSYTILF